MTLWRRRRTRLGRRPLLPLMIVGMLMLPLLLGPGGAMRCLAHPGNVAAALAKVQPDGTFEIRFRFDLLAYALSEKPNHVADGPMNALLDGPPAELETRLGEAKARFRQNFRVGASGPEAIDKLTFPSAADVLQSVKGVRMRLPVMASVVVAGHLPPGAKTISFQFDEALGTLILTTEFPYQEPISEPVEAGAFSDKQPIPTPDAVARAAAEIQAPSAASQTEASPPPPRAAMAKPARPAPKRSVALSSPSAKPAPRPVAATAAAKPKDGTRPALLTIAPSPKPVVPPPTQTAKIAVALPRSVVVKPRPSPPPALLSSPAATPSPEPARAAFSPNSTKTPSAPPASLRWLTHVGRYIKMGYTHILPEGLDHILFVLGLFLLSAQIKPLLKQITAFTLAHSLTLALSLYGVVHLPPSFVEPVIAASIAFVAVENLFTSEMKAWRPAVVFGFGLIHGMGFATALQSLGLQHDNLLTALLGFNVGVELGQLSVVLAAFLIVGWFRNRPNYRKFVVLPGSVAIAATAVFWMFQRIL